MCCSRLLSNFCKIKKKKELKAIDVTETLGSQKVSLILYHFIYGAFEIRMLSLCPTALILYYFFKRMWLHCQNCSDAKEICSAPKNLKKVLSSVSMWNRITAAPHWALKGLSRKWMFWLNSSHLKIVVGVNGGQNRGGLCQAEPVKPPRKTQEQESCRAPQIEQLMSPQGITTVGAIPLQERQGNFTGAWPFVRVSTAGTSPEGPFTETLMGPRVPALRQVLRSALKIFQVEVHTILIGREKGCHRKWPKQALLNSWRHLLSFTASASIYTNQKHGNRLSSVHIYLPPHCCFLCLLLATRRGLLHQSKVTTIQRSKPEERLL